MKEFFCNYVLLPVLLAITFTTLFAFQAEIYTGSFDWHWELCVVSYVLLLDIMIILVAIEKGNKKNLRLKIAIIISSLIILFVLAFNIQDRAFKRARMNQPINSTPHKIICQLPNHQGQLFFTLSSCYTDTI